MPIGGGPVTTLCRVDGVPLGASWGDDNTITFATNSPTTGLWRVSADGGEPTVLTTPVAAQHEGDHAFPSVLPRGRGVMFTIAMAEQADSPQVAVLDLKTGQRKTLIRGGSDAHYVETGHLIFAAAGALRAVRFDLARLEVLGDPITIVEHVLMKPPGAADYAVSRSGTFVYVPSGTDQQPMRSLVWVDRKGHEEHIKAPLRAYGLPRISPDGTRVVIAIYDQENTEIWIWDLARETLRRLTFSPGMDGMPFWTPDGRQIIFHSERTGVGNIYGQAADGNGTADPLTTSPNPQWPTAISPDGTWLAGFDHLPRRHSDIVFFPLRRPVIRPGSGPSPESACRHRNQLTRPGSQDGSPSSLRTVAMSRTSRMNLASSRSTCDGSRRSTAAAGKSRPGVGRVPRGREAGTSFFTLMDRILSPRCRSGCPD